MNPVRRALKSRHEFLVGAAEDAADEDWQDRVGAAGKRLAQAGGEGEAEVRAFFIFFLLLAAVAVFAFFILGVSNS